MANGNFNVPFPSNEPVWGYAPGSPERAAIMKEVARLSSKTIEIPARIGGRKVRTGRMADAVMPHDHAHVLGRWHKCRKPEVDRAINSALDAHAEWSQMPWQSRAAIFLKAAELLARLEKLCPSGCEELEDLRAAFAGKQTSSRAW